MIELLMNGELRPSRAWKLATVIIPIFAVVALVLFVKYSRWNEKRKNIK